ncbi:MAG: hypothetical protein AAGA42_16015 [Actinomycetota bacterium]
MARSPQSYQKRQRELRKKERKQEKLAIRHGKSAAKADVDEGPSEDELLEEFRLLNEKFAAGDVNDEDFEYEKAVLFSKLGLGEAPEPREGDEATDADESATADES